MGIEVTLSDGDDVGLTLGYREGLFVGDAKLGDTEGPAECHLDGSPEDMLEGFAECQIDGAPEGVFEGPKECHNDGASEGPTECHTDGCPDGEDDGNSVGSADCDGLSVGHADGGIV